MVANAVTNFTSSPHADEVAPRQLTSHTNRNSQYLGTPLNLDISIPPRLCEPQKRLTCKQRWRCQHCHDVYTRKSRSRIFNKLNHYQSQGCQLLEATLKFLPACEGAPPRWTHQFRHLNHAVGQLFELRRRHRNLVSSGPFASLEFAFFYPHFENSDGGLFSHLHGALCVRPDLDYGKLVNWFFGMGVELYPPEPRKVRKLKAWIQYCVGKYYKGKKEKPGLAGLSPDIAIFVYGRRLLRQTKIVSANRPAVISNQKRQQDTYWYQVSVCANTLPCPYWVDSLLRTSTDERRTRMKRLVNLLQAASIYESGGPFAVPVPHLSVKLAVSATQIKSDLQMLVDLKIIDRYPTTPKKPVNYSYRGDVVSQLLSAYQVSE